MTRRGFLASLFAAAVARMLPAARPRLMLPEPEKGVTIRMVKFDGAWRMDVLAGGRAIWPEMSCRILG